MTLPRTSVELLVGRIHCDVSLRQGMHRSDSTAKHGQANGTANSKYRGKAMIDYIKGNLVEHVMRWNASSITVRNWAILRQAQAF